MENHFKYYKKLTYLHLLFCTKNVFPGVCCTKHVFPRTIHFWLLGKSLVSGPGRCPPSWNSCFAVTKSCLILCYSMDCSPPLSPGVCSNSCPLSWWGYLNILPPALFSFAFNLSQPVSFLVKWLFISGGQSTGASASAAVLPMNIQSWLPLRIWPCCPRDPQ